MIKVFVAEDSLLVRKEIVLTTPWDELGLIVVGESANGLDAYKKIKELKPDILITDIKMQDMNGLELIRALKQEIDMEYIVVSAYSEFEYAMSAIKLEVKNYILKPIDDVELISTLKQLVEVVNKKNVKHTSTYSAMQVISENLELNSYSNFVMNAMTFVCDNYMNSITVKDMADFLHISESYLGKIFKKELKMTVNEYLLYIRMKEAMSLLKNTQTKIYDVAEAVGYKDYRHFSQLFRKYVGIYPKEYQRYISQQKSN